MDLDEWRKDLKEIGDLSVKHKCKYILADIRKLESTPSLDEIYETVSSILPKDLRYALVSSPNHPIAEQSRHFETTSLQNGIRVAIFNSTKDAERWLML